MLTNRQATFLPLGGFLTGSCKPGNLFSLWNTVTVAARQVPTFWSGHQFIFTCAQWHTLFATNYGGWR